jgi:hypothetical protein
MESSRIPALRLPAADLAGSGEEPIRGYICAAMWPTMSLETNKYWFDELSIWTEGFNVTVTQRARLQVNALRKALAIVQQEKAGTVCVTLSFGTIERHVDLLTSIFEQNMLYKHRIMVQVRGQLERARSPYRVHGFVEFLRGEGISIGYRIMSPRIGMDVVALDHLKPDFGVLRAPTSSRIEFWEGVIVEARSMGFDPGKLIVAGIDDPMRVELARRAHFGFGQGVAISPIKTPPWTRDGPKPAAASSTAPAAAKVASASRKA